MIRKLIGATFLIGSLAFAGPASAGSIYLTGHDVLLHSGQNSYDNVILDWLRGAGTLSEIPAASYDILLLRGFEGSVGTLGVNTLEGFGTITAIDINTLASDADLTAALVGKEVVVVADHESCGGCDLSDADADILEARAGAFTSFFNAGGDIFGGSGAMDTTYYNFLPPTAVASGMPIGGSSGFVATGAGLGIGILPGMINGFPTHNRFSSFDPVFTVFETRPQTSGPAEIISLGVRDARIIEDDITTDIGTDDVVAPEPASLGLLALGLAATAAARRRRAKAKA